MKTIKKIDSILYVEDEKNIQEELAEVIEQFCETLYLANNGLEGWQLFQKYQPRVVVTDIKMPIMNGIEFAKKVFEQSSQTHIIFTTAFTDTEFLQQAIEIHADGYVIKPIDLEKLEALLNKVIRIDELQEEVKKRIESESKRKAELETILATTIDGIAIIDLSSKFLYANNAFEKMLGYSLSELKQFHMKNLFNEEEPKSIKSMIEQISHTGFIENFQLNFLKKDNKPIIVNTSLALMPDKEKILIATKDITQEVYSQKKMEEYLALIDENIITSTTDLDGVITYASKAFCQISKYTKEELIGKKHNIVRETSMPKEIYDTLWETITANQVWEGELKNKNKYGQTYWVYVKIYPIYNEEGIKTGYTSIRHDITNLKKVEELAITDSLTQIYNRRYYNDVVVNFIQGAKRHNDWIAFMIFDIDYFKQYNDTYGHQKGDEALQAVAKSIKESLNRSEDYLFRLGGEEFGVLFKPTSKDKAIEFSTELIETVHNLGIEHSKSEVASVLTVSGGLMCQKAMDIQSDQSFYSQADSLLYKAKKSGRNQLKYNEDRK